MTGFPISGMWPFRLFKKVSIRPMTEGDLPYSNALTNHLLDLEAPAKGFDSGGKRYTGFVAEVKEGGEKRIVGLATMGLDKKTGTARLQDIYIDRFYRGRKISTRLVGAHLERAFGELGAKEATAFLARRDTRKGVPKELKKLGFSPSGEPKGTRGFEVAVKRDEYLRSEARRKAL